MVQHVVSPTLAVVRGSVLAALRLMRFVVRTGKLARIHFLSVASMGVGSSLHVVSRRRTA